MHRIVTLGLENKKFKKKFLERVIEIWYLIKKNMGFLPSTITVFNLHNFERLAPPITQRPEVFHSGQDDIPLNPASYHIHLPV